MDFFFFSLQKLVNETFQQMWFAPLPTANTDKLLKRALNVIEVVAASKEFDWLEQLLTNVSKGSPIDMQPTTGWL